MRISKVKWANHPVLGNLELDFIHGATGLPFDTILFAGENGTGKTTILESISTFLNLGSFEFFDYIEYIVNNRTFRAIPSSHAMKSFYDRADDTGTVIKIHSDKHNSPDLIRSDILDPRHYGCIFSKARADYKTKAIQSTTVKALDTDKYDKDDEDDFTSLKQLIVDIENQDNADYVDEHRTPGGSAKNWTEFYPTSKIYRFKKAFDTFFETLKYKKVTDYQSEKAILFEKNGQTISIDKLSTGEKQIVFRGIYLLKNQNQLDGASIMIDEPELSMHPKWQKRILKYYQDLFITGGIQKTQIFIATHSEHVLKHALEDKTSKLLIVLRNDAGNITAKRIDTPGVLPSITDAETNYTAFDIVSNDYHIELYGWLQNKEAKHSVKSCDDFIKAHVEFDPSIHGKPSMNPHTGTTYGSLSTYIRNAIDHPSPGSTFTEDELRTSIELLINICK